ncbi:MAG: tubulin-like doman-containing protein [Propionibacteriaceae bacterium]
MSQILIDHDGSNKPTLQRALIIGCGGSGGNTLTYMMDQLRSELAQIGIDKIPQGWQFMFIDAPLDEQNPVGGLRKVKDEVGIGDYVSVGNTAQYEVIQHHVLDNLAAKNPAAMATCASWVSPVPQRITTPISVGAGQYRSIGRMLTLSTAQKISSQLQSAWTRLQAPEAHASLSTLSALGGYSPAKQPIVFVVGSMAGGSGASMVLDVCRILTTISGVNPGLTGVYAVTPDLFTSIPKDQRSGVNANALAMLGEVVAAQTGASRETDEMMLSALGISTKRIDVPFARIFPIGIASGLEGTGFGDGTPLPVYRGLARGLSSMLTSPTALQQYIEYDLGNTQGWATQSMEPFGWGSASDTLAWGSFGYASLSMGRDRYATYSAQRIARMSVDRLQHGHEIVGGPVGGTAQLDLRISQTWEIVCQRLGLPNTMAEIGGWIGGDKVWPIQQVMNVANGIFDQIIMPNMTQLDGVKGNQWVPNYNRTMSDTEMMVRQELQKEAYRFTYGWAPNFLNAVLNEITVGISQYGLSYAAALVDRLRTHIDSVLVSGLQQLSETQIQGANISDQSVLTQLSAMTGIITNGAGFMQRLRTSLIQNYTNFIWIELCKLLKTVISDFSAQVCAPLAQEIRYGLKIVETATSASGRMAGLAELHTTHYPDWPSDTEPKPSERWDEATNDVLLMTSAQYQARYDVDLQSSLHQPSMADARNAVSYATIAGEWQTTGGDIAPGGLIEMSNPWRSHALVRNPNNPAMVDAPSVAKFVVHVRPDEILDRATKFVRRQGESYRVFCDTSLKAYAAEAEAQIDTNPRAVLELRDKFREAMTRALPLAQVDGPLVKKLYNKDVAYRFKFSSIPFAESRQVAQLLEKVANDYEHADRDVVPANFAKAVSTSEQERRIDIFGSYPNLIPLAFSSVLAPAMNEWQQLSGDSARAGFWNLRRSRPLEAALPVSESERRALVTGWYIGLITGALEVPTTSGRLTDEFPRIYDSEASRWMPFPNPMLTPQGAFPSARMVEAQQVRALIDLDWLPAVLESLMLSMVNCSGDPELRSRQPYIALRRLYDEAKGGPTQGSNVVSGEIVLEKWLISGSSPSGTVGRVTGDSIDEREANALQFIQGTRQTMARLFGPGARYDAIRDQQILATAPMMRDVYQDVLWACDRIDALIRPAAESARRSEPLPTTNPVDANQDWVF